MKKLVFFSLFFALITYGAVTPMEHRDAASQLTPQEKNDSRKRLKHLIQQTFGSKSITENWTVQKLFENCKKAIKKAHKEGFCTINRSPQTSEALYSFVIGFEDLCQKFAPEVARFAEASIFRTGILDKKKREITIHELCKPETDPQPDYLPYSYLAKDESDR